MTTVSNIDSNEQAVETQFSKLATDIGQLIADEKLSGPLVDSINARLVALATAMGTVDSQVTAADPGSSSSSSS